MRFLQTGAWCGLLTLLAGTTAVWAQEKPIVTVIDGATIAAYEKLGASCHLRAQITDNGLHYSIGFPPTERCVAAISVVREPQGELPDVSVPFCLNFAHGALTEAQLKKLGGHKNLVALDVDGYAITDATLKDVAGIKKLRALSLVNSQLTGVGLKKLAVLKDFSVLRLHTHQVTDAGLKELAGLKKLTVLGLSSPKVTTAGLKELASIKSLRTLDLDDQLLTDANLRALREVDLLHKLRQAVGKGGARPQSPDEVVSLHLAGAPITDVGLKEVASFKKLSALVLCKTRVTDAGLTQLEPLQHLTHLDLQDTQVTAAGLLYLREALPKCKVVR